VYRLIGVQYEKRDTEVCLIPSLMVQYNQSVTQWSMAGLRNLLLTSATLLMSGTATARAVVLNLGSRDPLGVPNANLGGPKCKSGLSTNFPQYFCLARVTSCFCVHTTHPILFSQPFQFRLLFLLLLSSLSLRAGSN